MTSLVLQQATKLADMFDIQGDAAEIVSTLKSTVFKGKDGVAVTDGQMGALLIVASMHRLNPFTKEIYAYPDKQNGIVPVVGVDGWARIINDHPQYDGMEFVYSEATVQHKGKTCHEWVECLMFRKDRTRPTRIREMFSEVVRNASFATPWDTHPNRMHRHKAMIQCARLAFGFSGIYDEDEAARIAEAGETINAATGEFEPRKRGPQRKSEKVSDGSRDDDPVHQEDGGAPDPGPASEEVISPSQAAYLRKKLAACGKDEAEALQPYGIDKVEQLPVAKFEELKGTLL